MQKRKYLMMAVGVVMIFYSALAQSQEEPGKKEILKGRELYLNHCASCHGLEGKGDGLVSYSLRKKPSDLTRIRKKDGKFPAEELKKIIAGETVLPVHGQREMPVWGSILKEPELTSLVKYLASIQRFPNQYPD
jgi:mono/diheme cytochrome c family protein